MSLYPPPPPPGTPTDRRLRIPTIISPSEVAVADIADVTLGLSNLDRRATGVVFGSEQSAIENLRSFANLGNGLGSVHATITAAGGASAALNLRATRGSKRSRISTLHTINVLAPQFRLRYSTLDATHGAGVNGVVPWSGVSTVAGGSGVDTVYVGYAEPFTAMRLVFSSNDMPVVSFTTSAPFANGQYHGLFFPVEPTPLAAPFAHQIRTANPVAVVPMPLVRNEVGAKAFLLGAWNYQGVSTNGFLEWSAPAPGAWSPGGLPAAYIQEPDDNDYYWLFFTPYWQSSIDWTVPPAGTLTITPT